MKRLMEYLAERNEEWCLEKWIVPAVGFFSLAGMGACMQRGMDYNHLAEEHDQIIQEVHESALERKLQKETREINPQEIAYMAK